MSACQRVLTLATKTAVVFVTGAVTDTVPIKSAHQTRVFPFYFHPRRRQFQTTKLCGIFAWGNGKCLKYQTLL